MKRLASLLLGIILIAFVASPVEAGRGCCSWHGGQSYCDTSVGRWVCGDGTYSPSCGCARTIPTKTLTPIVLPKTSTPKPTLIPTTIPTISPTPTLAPTQSPQVQGTSTSSGGSVLGSLAGIGIFSFAAWKGLKWLGRKTASKEQT